jgi:hypothetical protein
LARRFGARLRRRRYVGRRIEHRRRRLDVHVDLKLDEHVDEHLHQHVDVHEHLDVDLERRRRGRRDAV